MPTAAPAIDVTFLDWAETVQERVEKIRGHVFHMAGGSRWHGRVRQRAGRMAEDRLTGWCEYLDSEYRLVVPGLETYLMPDGMIACPANWVSAKHGLLDNPTVVFEVLSASTAAYDLGPKLKIYERVQSVREIVVLGSLAPFAHHFHRADFADELVLTLHDGFDTVIRLSSLGIELPLETIYAGMDFPTDDEGL